MHSVRQHVTLRFRRRSRFRPSWRRKRSVWMLWWKQNAAEPWRLTKRLTSCAKSSGWGEEDKHKPCRHGFWFEVRNYFPANAYHFNSRAKQQIYEQIQKRLVDKIMQEEIQKLERQQEVVKQEKSYLKDLKVHPIKRSPHQYLYKLNTNTGGGGVLATTCLLHWFLPASLQALERKKEEQRHLHEENLRINTETIRTKEQRREEEKLLDMRDMEYLKKKLVKQNTRADGLQVIPEFT